MATHDYNLANQSGASFRSDLNNALSAILSNNSNASSPATTVAYMIWADTNNNKLKIRNSANSAWVDLINLDGAIDRDITFTGASANIVFDASDNELQFKDNAKATFGDSADLTITHNGSSSIINDTGSGNIQLQQGGNTILTVNSLGIEITDPNGSANLVVKGFEGSNAALHLTADEGDDDGDQWLILSQASTGNLKFYNNLSGSSSEVWAITGEGDVTMTGHLIIPDSHQLRLGNATNGDLTIEHDGSNSIINDNGTGELILKRAGNTVLTLGSSGMKLQDPNGAVELTMEAFEGNNVQIRMAADEGDDNGDTWLIVSSATTNNFRFLNDVSGSQSEKWHIDTSGNVTQVGGLVVGGTIRSSTNDAHDLGTSSIRFDDIFLTSNPNVSSDKNLKNTIATSDLGLDFINKLNPVSYKFNGKTRTHYGLIAQEIETVLGTISKSASQFAGFCKDEVDDDGNAMTAKYGLRYNEFISPMIKAIQELSAKVTALEGS